RPYHTIIPGMATYAVDDSLYASFGVMGGFMQPQGHLQVLVNMIIDELNPQEALDQPRFCITDGKSDGIVALEEGISSQVMGELASMGHPIQPTSGMQRAIFGRGQIIQRDPNHGSYWAGSDMRADGLAMTI
ncbi:MAG: gamma-glutamyltransferase, partial [Gammaproteobacteria bacterium]|nr:gamma-glutamyltransferase [Gammaproteobacteria bacterium]